MDAEQRRADAHLRAQSDMLLLGMIPYSQVFQMERMSAALDAFGQHLAQSGNVTPVELETLNESVAQPWRSYFDETTAAFVADAYAADFAAFGYDPADWRGGRSDFSESPVERQLRAEIVARNAMIDKLYDFLI